MKRILITGANGLLGQKCVALMQSKYHVYGCDLHEAAFSRVAKTDYFQLDITRREGVKKAVMEIYPECIINAAAYTDVDGCETQRELCWKVNVDGVHNLIHAAEKVNAKIIHVSTDYVFDGKKGPYQETDTPSPLGYYGKSKLASENALLQSDLEFAILRTMILYGVGYHTRPNFVLWLIQKLSNKEPVTIVNDQYGNPTIAEDLARAIDRVIELEKFDLFHVAGSEYIDRYGFAVRVAEYFKLDATLIKPISTDQLKQSAPRPLRSGFILEKMKNRLEMETMNISDSLKILKKQLKKIRL